MSDAAVPAVAAGSVPHYSGTAAAEGSLIFVLVIALVIIVVQRNRRR